MLFYLNLIKNKVAEFYKLYIYNKNNFKIQFVKKYCKTLVRYYI